MSEQEFPSELVERCARPYYANNFASPDAWRDLVLSVLREIGHAELVAALKDARPLVSQVIGTRSMLAEIDAALRKAGAL